MEKEDYFIDNIEECEGENDSERKARLSRMKEEKEKQLESRAKVRKYAPYGVGVAAILLILIFAIAKISNSANDKQTQIINKAEIESVTEEISEVQESTEAVTEVIATVPEIEETPKYSAHLTEDTLAPGEELISQTAIFIDRKTGDILLQKDYDEIISPASMTKVLTVLVAAEHVTNLEDTFTITRDITDYSYVHDCSNVGFEVDETVTVQDLFYGTILPSGADAAVGLAIYVAGSHEAFVDMMNEKVEELGLSETAHFTNCVGLYDKEHHCTVYDMAMILEAAIENPLCREVLSAHTYRTSVTEQHDEGLLISNWFLRRIEDKDTGGEVICAKTGYVVQSRNCAASFGKDNAGNEYICVTGGSTSSWNCIRDHVALYKQFAKE